MTSTDDISVAIVTGASRGLGAALTGELIRRGWTVVVDARDAASLATTVEPLGPGVVPVPGDVTDAGHRRELVSTARGHGTLRLVVANGGTLGPSPLPRLADVALDDVTSTFTTNAIAQLGLAQAALGDLRDSRGTLALVTSDAAVEAYGGWGVYGASKAALEQFARVLAVEEPLLTVQIVDPGDLRTAMHQDAFPGEDISDRPEPESVAGPMVDLLTSGSAGRLRVAEAVVPT